MTYNQRNGTYRCEITLHVRDYMRVNRNAKFRRNFLADKAHYTIPVPIRINEENETNSPKSTSPSARWTRVL